MKKALVTSKSAISAASDVLKASAWLARLAPDVQDKLLAKCHWQRFPAGSTIGLAGDDTGGLLGIAEGCVHYETSLAIADVSLVEIVPAPFWMVTRTLLRGESRQVSTIAQTDVLAAFLPQGLLAAMMAESPGLRMNVIRNISDLFDIVLMALADALIPDNRVRCITVLLRIAGRRDHGDAPAIAHATQEQLAALTNLSRQKTGDVLRELASSGLVELGYRRIAIPDPAALRALLPGR